MWPDKVKGVYVFCYCKKRGTGFIYIQPHAKCPIGDDAARSIRTCAGVRRVIKCDSIKPRIVRALLSLISVVRRHAWVGYDYDVEIQHIATTACEWPCSGCGGNSVNSLTVSYRTTLISHAANSTARVLLIFSKHLRANNLDRHWRISSIYTHCALTFRQSVCTQQPRVADKVVDDDAATRSTCFSSCCSALSSSGSGVVLFDRSSKAAQ